VTTPISVSTVKAPLFEIVMSSVPPPFARTPETTIEAGVTVTFPGVRVEKVPLNKVWAPDMMASMPPVNVKLLPLPVNEPVVQLIVPVVDTPLTLVSAVVMSRDPPFIAVPVIVAVPAPEVPMPR
jgi:hypothetical protein